MENKLNEGTTLVITAGAAIAAGEIVDLGVGLCGVAVDAIANGAQGVVCLTGMFRVAKKTAGTAIAAGTPLTYNTKAVEVVTINSATTTAQLADVCGYAVVASGTASTTVDMKLK